MIGMNNSGSVFQVPKKLCRKKLYTLDDSVHNMMQFADEFLGNILEAITQNYLTIKMLL